MDAMVLRWWAAGSYFGGALQGQSAGAIGQLLLLDEAQVVPHDRTVRHDGTRDRTCSELMAPRYTSIH